MLLQKFKETLTYIGIFPLCSVGNGLYNDVALWLNYSLLVVTQHITAAVVGIANLFINIMVKILKEYFSNISRFSSCLPEPGRPFLYGANEIVFYPPLIFCCSHKDKMTTWTRNSMKLAREFTTVSKEPFLASIS